MASMKKLENALSLCEWHDDSVHVQKNQCLASSANGTGGVQYALVLLQLVVQGGAAAAHGVEQLLVLGVRGRSLSEL